AVNRYGIEAGRRTLRYVAHQPAAYERINSSARGSGARRPRIIAMGTGKNVRYVAMTTTEVTFGPTAKTSIGARATIGIVWLATTYGTSARSASCQRTKTVAKSRPSSAPTMK